MRSKTRTIWRVCRFVTGPYSICREMTTRRICSWTSYSPLQIRWISASKEVKCKTSSGRFYITLDIFIILCIWRVRLPDSRGSVANLFAGTIRDLIKNVNPQMVVCIVPNQNKDTYDAIKRTCCVDYGLPSQVVTSNIINPNNMNKTRSVITKLAVQMNCKLGGEIWGVVIPVRKLKQNFPPKRF